MSTNPKEVFEVAATTGLGARGFTPRVMAIVLQGVKQTIDELRNGSDTPTVDPTLPEKVKKNTDAISENASDISELSLKLKDLQSQIDALKNIKVTKRNESIAKRKGIA